MSSCARLSDKCVRPKRSIDEHAVAVGVEAVFGFDGVTISGEGMIFSSESANEHEQARLWKMEVGQHGVNDAEFVSGIDEDVGFARAGLDFWRLRCGEFQCTDSCCANGYDAPLGFLRAIDRRSVYG